VVFSINQTSELSIKNNKIWIISEGRYVDVDLKNIVDDAIEGPVKEYRLSDIGRYLLNPNSIEVKKKLIGCEIHYKQGVLKKIGKTFRKLLPAVMKRQQNDSISSPEVIISRVKLRLPPLKDPGLEAHLNNICDQLRCYDSVQKRLAKLEARNIFQMVGICEDLGSNYSYLKLQGRLDEKIKYLGNFISKDVGVILNKAHIAEGLFELRGYEFECYEADRSHRLISYDSESQQKAYVLTPDNQVDFHLSEPQLIRYMHLLEQALKVNPCLKESFSLGIQGQIKPLKLFFNRKLEIDYSNAYFPEIYRNVFKALNIELNQRNLIKPILNYLQIGVSLSYVSLADPVEDRMFTQVSVLHDFRALEPLRKNLPQVYTEMSKRASITEAGRYYLLDSIDGYCNAY
jgi:hypothetical protein